MTAANTLRRPPTARFEDLDVGEPIDVRLARFDAPAGLRAGLKELRRGPVMDLVLVLHLPHRLGRDELPGLLDAATGVARRVVLIPPAGQDMAAVRNAAWPAEVQVEPDARRAVVGVMQALPPDGSLVILWPDEAGLADPAALVALGGRWRAAWEAPEDGEFHDLPPENVR